MGVGGCRPVVGPSRGAVRGRWTCGCRQYDAGRRRDVGASEVDEATPAAAVGP